MNVNGVVVGYVPKSDFNKYSQVLVNLGKFDSETNLFRSFDVKRVICPENIIPKFGERVSFDMYPVKNSDYFKTYNLRFLDRK